MTQQSGTRAATRLASGVTVRDLTDADLTRVVQLHRQAFPHSALTALGQRAVKRYYRSHTHERYEPAFLGAYHVEGLVGFFLAGVFPGSMSAFVTRNWIHLTWRVLTHPWLMTNSRFRQRVVLGLRFLRWRKSAPGGSAPEKTASSNRSLNLLAISIHPDWQGRGVGTLLMRELERIAQQRGFAQMHLGVNTDNVQAIRFYEGLGWERTKKGGTWKGRMRKRLVP